MQKYAFNLGEPRVWLPPKILMIMKLIVIMMTTCLLQVSAASFAQKMTMVRKNTTLAQVLKEITLQTGYEVLYSDQKIDVDRKIDVNFNNTDLKEVLENCLEGQSLDFAIEDKVIVIKKKEPTFLERLAERWASIDISGRVVDADGRGLPGASVSVKGKGGKAVSTGANGSFYLKGVDEDAILVVSFIGYVSKEVKAAKELGDVVLEVSLSKLDEVQVIAYGTTTQRLSTGNVTTIKADVIEKQPVNNPLLALQGRVPGLFIEQATGFAGTGVKVRIQGTNSLLNGNDPLYVVDGIPFTSQLLSIKNFGSGSDLNSILGSSGNGNYSSPLNFINPSDIESIDVLKDADATAIYGSRAANGAILITTKKGGAGDIRLDVNIQNGLGRVTRKLDLMGSEQYLEMRREALKNDGITTLKINDYDLNGAWDNRRSTDWQKELIGGTAKYLDMQASVSGGSNNTNFLVGAGYHKEGNVFPGDFNDLKKSVHFNLNSTSLNQKFKLQFSGSYLDDNNKLPQIDLTSYAMTLSPVAPSLYASDGSVNWQFNSAGAPTFISNPINYLYQKYKNATTNLISNAILGYQIIDGLEIKSGFGYNKLQTSIVNTSYSVLPPQSTGFSVFGSSGIDSWSIEPQLSYKRNINKGSFELLLGSTIQQETRDASSITADGFNSPQVMEDIKSATTLYSGPTANSVYKYSALFGRINYNWKNKYIFNLTARRDGSSRFGIESQLHNFTAMGASWIFSEEELFKRKLDFLSFGKLRVSYGTTGSDQIGDYNYMSLYNAITLVNAPYQGAIGYQPSNLTNPYLQWEETTKLQVGLDLGFFNDRLLLNTNYSLNRSSNQLLNDILPSTSGFGIVAANRDATVQNSGWEFSVSTTNMNISDFKWSSNINLTVPKNRLLTYRNLDKSPYRGYFMIGQPINRIKLYHYLGVNTDTGLYEFTDHNGKPTYSPVASEDDYAYLNTDPKFFGGFQNTFKYKGIQLDVLFQFTKQVGPNYRFGNGGNALAGRFVNGLGNKPSWQLDRWQGEGDVASFQRYTTGLSAFTNLNNALNSDASWSDASYVRLKNISISWQLPSDWKKWMHFRNFRLYAQGQNLLTITNYKGLDPETKNSLSLPPLRVITIGIQVGL